MMYGTVLEFIKWGLKHVKKSSIPVGAILPIPRSEVGSLGEWEYILGTTGEVVTQTILDNSFRTYYSKHGRTRAEFDKITAGWVTARKRVCDCQGVEDNYSHSQKWADYNYRNYCTAKGLCSAIDRPYILGEAVFNGTDGDKSHVGWVCGWMPNGDILVMEERGLDYGFVVTLISKRPWKYRGLMTNRYTYDMAATGTQKVKPTGFIFTRVLEYGCRGADVKELKKALVAKGYKNLDVTNDRFLGETKRTLIAFQAEHGLTKDGKAGSRTYGTLGVLYKL